MSRQSGQVKVYGADWCEDTQATRNQLDSLGVPYQYIDVDEDAQAQEWIKRQNNGKQVTPTVDIDGKILFEPDERELELALRGTGLMS
jgi:glutaredoxin